jgi:hypothetical protein
MGERLLRELQSKLRDELLNGDIFCSLAEAKVIIEAWRRYYNTERPHSSLGYKPPAPEAIIWPAPPRGSAPPPAQVMAEKPISIKTETGPPYGVRPRVPCASGPFPNGNAAPIPVEKNGKAIASRARYPTTNRGA